MAPAGDLSLVDTVARGELQFFVPGVDLFLKDRGMEESACEDSTLFFGGVLRSGMHELVRGEQTIGIRLAI